MCQEETEQQEFSRDNKIEKIYFFPIFALNQNLGF